MACSRSRFFTHWIPRFWKLWCLRHQFSACGKAPFSLPTPRSQIWASHPLPAYHCAAVKPTCTHWQVSVGPGSGSQATVLPQPQGASFPIPKHTKLIPSCAWNVLLDLSGFLTILAERPFVTFQPKVMTWWYRPVILGVERKRQVKSNEFKASLGYETLTPSNEASLLLILPIYYCFLFHIEIIIL